MENIKQLKEMAYAVATNEYEHATEDRVEAMKVYALLVIAETKTTKED